jgi:hypothetical protein
VRYCKIIFIAVLKQKRERSPVPKPHNFLKMRDIEIDVNENLGKTKMITTGLLIYLIFYHFIFSNCGKRFRWLLVQCL